MESVRENVAIVLDRAEPLQEVAPGVGTSTAATSLLRQTVPTDTSSTFQRSAKWSHLEPAEALTFGTMLQIARLFGGELGVGIAQTWVMVRDQLYSNLRLTSAGRKRQWTWKSSPE
jgi:hypothetical protein